MPSLLKQIPESGSVDIDIDRLQDKTQADQSYLPCSRVQIEVATVALHYQCRVISLVLIKALDYQCA